MPYFQFGYGESQWEQDAHAISFGVKDPQLDLGWLEEVRSVMAYPDDKNAEVRERRQEYRDIETAKIALLTAQLGEQLGYPIIKVVTDPPAKVDMVAIPCSVLERILNSPSYEELTKGLEKRFSYAYTVGEILLTIIGYAREKPERASLSKAVEAVSQRIEKAGTSPHSPAVLIREWSQFKTVAHLWAALRLVSEKQGTACSRSSVSSSATPSPRPRMPAPAPPIGTAATRWWRRSSPFERYMDDRRGRRFLSFSEALLREAGSIFPHGQKVPVLDPAQAWRPRPEVCERALTEVEPVIPLSDSVRKCMDKYRAPQKI